MEKILEDEAAYYRQRTVARLIDKRRQIESLEQKEAELKKMEEMKFRVQWKEGFKKKRSEMVSTKVDKQIMHRTLRLHPDMLSQIINMEKFGVVETKPDESLVGLVDHFEDHEVSTESGQIHSTMALQSSGMIQFPGTKPNPAIQFLQNAATFKLAVNSRLRELHAQHGKGSSDYVHCTDSMDFSRGSSRMRHSLSATDSESDDQRVAASGAVMIAKSQEHRAFHSYRSELQISQLVLNLLHEPQTSGKKKHHDTLSTAMGVNGINVPPRSGAASEKSLVSQLLQSSRPIKTTGLMCRVFTDSSSRQGLNAVPLERTASFSLHRSSIAASASVVGSGGGRLLLQGSAVKRSGGDTVAGASSVGSGGTGSDEHSRAPGVIPLSEPAALSNGMFCSLADALFLLGPSARSLQEQIDLRRNEIPDPNSNKTSPPAPSVPDFNTTVSPTIIFATENSYPAEMFSLLPMYCFPSDVEVGVRATKPAQDLTSPTGKRRKNSLNLLTQKVVAEANASLGKSAKKRNAVFFPSDFTLGLGMSSARDSSVPKADPGLIAAVADPALPAVNAHISARNSFVLLLGDHTYQQFGLCIQLPMTFKMEQDLIIHTSYVLCLMTKLPMFSYLLHIVDQFDAYMDGLKFSSPVPTQDMNFPYVSELRPLSDFAAKLKRLLVPKYPYIISSAVSNLAVPSERRRSDTVGGVSSPAAPRNPCNGLVDTEYPALENDQDTKAVLPDVEFTYGAIAASRKLHAPFRRSAYQSYFSEMGMKFDPGNKTLADLIARYDRMIADFAPNSMHRSEKEKEESYMVMLWALPVLLKHLPLDQVVLALGCAITEMRIIVKHPDLHVVSCVIMALIQLLRPLKWCMPVVMILPDSLDGMLGSPTPIIIGVPKLPDYFTLLDGYVVVDPQEHIVHLNPIDVVESHTILLPHGSKLVNALNASAETILRCTKKKRHTRYRRSVPVETETGVDALATAATTSAVPSASVPLPVELDLSSYENLQLLAAIKTFTGLVSNHIQAILNTAIQMQQQSKQVSQDQRRLLIRSTGEHRKPTKPKATTNSNLTATAPATTTPSAALASEGADAQLDSVPVQALMVIPQIDTLPLADEKDTALHAAAVQALMDSPVHAQESHLTNPTATPEPAVPESLSPASDRRLSGSRELKASPKHTTKRKAGRQSDIGPGSAHSPIDPRSSLKTTALKRSPAMRHSLPPASTKTPSPRKQGKVHSPMLDPKAAAGGKAKENMTENLKLNLKNVHAPAHNHPHPPHSVRDRKSLGGNSSHPKTAASKDHISHHGKKTAEAELLHATSRSTDLSPLPSTGTNTTKTWSPRVEETEPEGATAAGKTDSARPNGSVDKAVAADPPAEVPADANLAVEGDNVGHFSPVPPHRLHSVSSLVLNIDSLVSPFVIPTPKAAKKPAANPVISPVFMNLPVSSPDNPSDEAHHRDSLNDETCSDITVTDAGGVHAAAEDGSGGGGNRVRTESSNDSGDKMSETMGSEYSSASSSLPSLKSNAPLLLVREIGQSGAKFMKKIHDTQMYSNHCVFVKKQSVLAAAKVAAPEKAAEGEGAEAGSGQGTDPAGEVCSPLTPRRSPHIWSQLNLIAVSAEELSDDEAPELQLDALHEVFSVMLSGSTVMPLSMQDSLVDQYNALYSHRARIAWEEISAKFSTAPPPLPSAMPSALQAMYTKAVQRYTDLATDPSKTRRAEDSKEPAVLWCNGLRCRGLCDTAYCTDICLTLWVERVRRLRQQAVFRNIVGKKHQAKSLLRSNAHIGSKGQDPADKLNDSAEGRAALAVMFAPKVEVVRHHRETQSQYEQRKSLVENRKLELLRLSSPAGAKAPAAAQRGLAKQRSIFGPAHGDMKKCLYARGSTADPATMAIAKHYAAKQRKLRASRVRRALRVLTPLMLRFVCLYRKYKFFNAIYLIQALIRGFYVRNHIPELVEALIARRIRRLLACIRIRRYLRQHSDQIYRRYVRAKMEEQRRRRASISIPVKMPPPAPTKADSYRQNSLPRVQKVYSISDDILPAAGITYVGLDGEQRVGSPPKRSTQARPTGESDSDLHSEAGAGIPADSEALSGKGHLDTATSELDSTKLLHNASTAASSPAAANKEAKPQRLSTGTYTERVKEYLQFGKMLHRGASFQLQMQQQSKYAAHHMQKRNSKPGKTLDSVAAAAVAASTLAREKVETTVEQAQLQAHQPAQTEIDVAAAVASVETPLMVASEESTTSVIEHCSITVSEGTQSSAEAVSENHAEQSTEQHDNALVSKRTKMDLRIATQFSVETIVDPSATPAAALPVSSTTDNSCTVHSESASVVESDPSTQAYTGDPEQLQGCGNEEEEPAPAGTMIISPTTGIPTLMGVVYPDSDDETERREKAGSLAFSEINGDAAPESVGSALSLLAITVVGDSMRTTSADGLAGIHVVQSQRPLTGRYSMGGGGEDDDRVSVLSGSTASTAHRKRSSAASGGSTTDTETAQPVLHSILGLQQQQQLRSIQSMTAVGSSGEVSVERGDPTTISAEAEAALAPDKVVAGLTVADDCTVLSVSSARTHRSINRNSTGTTSASNLLFDMNAMKKMSPIGRYAQEKSYDMARLFTPRPGSALVSRASFKSQSEDPQGGAEGGVVSPLMKRTAVGGRTPRIGVLEKESIKQRRQSLALGSTSAYGRRFGSLEELSEEYEESEKGLERSQSELFDGMLLDAESYTLGGKSAAMQGAMSHRRSSTGSMVAGDGSPADLNESFRKMPAVDSGALPLPSLFTQSCSPRFERGSHSVSPVRSATEDVSGAVTVENRPSDSSVASEANQLAHLSEVTSAKTQQSEEAKQGFAGEEEEDFDEDELEFIAVDDLQEAIRVAPLKTLGCNVTDYINRQQLHTLLDMWNLLREGVEVLKHGRRGNPKFKTLLCDVNLTKLYWRSQGSRADPDMDNLPEDASYYPTLLDPSATAAVLTKGVAPSEAPTPSATNVHRLSTPFGTKSNADRVLYIRDIVEVREDCGTEVMQRSVAKGYLTAGRTSTISIVLEDHTLDFEIEEAIWGSLFHALQILVNFYQVMMAAPRATMSIARPPDGFFNFLTYDSTGSSHGKKRGSSGIGNMLLHRRSSRADNNEDSAALL